MVDHGLQCIETLACMYHTIVLAEASTSYLQSRNEFLRKTNSKVKGFVQSKMFRLPVKLALYLSIRLYTKTSYTQ